MSVPLTCLLTHMFFWFCGSNPCTGTQLTSMRAQKSKAVGRKRLASCVLLLWRLGSDTNVTGDQMFGFCVAGCCRLTRLSDGPMAGLGSNWYFLQGMSYLMYLQYNDNTAAIGRKHGRLKNNVCMSQWHLVEIYYNYKHVASLGWASHE